MDWTGLIINVLALVAGLVIYIIIYKSPLGEKLSRYQYPVLLVVVIISCVIGGLIKLAVSGLSIPG